MNKQEALAELKKVLLNKTTPRFIKDSKVPSELSEYLYDYINPRYSKERDTLSRTYATDRKFSDKHWDELEQVLEVYYSPLYQALL